MVGSEAKMVIAEKKLCQSCGKSVRSDTRTGYCAECFHRNVDGVKTKYNSARWESGHAKKTHWAFRGAILTDEDIQRFNDASECGICSNTFSGKDKCLDHCHSTGAYRGALCRQCNAALGKLGDDLDLVISRLKNYTDKVKW